MAAPVSFVVPVYNGERHVREAIESLLSQTLPAAEIFVVDDGSTDSSVEVASSFGDRVTLIVQENRGVGVARNAGVEAATQPYIAWLDHDDVAEPTRVETQLNAFETKPTPDIVFGGMSQFLSPELPEDVAASLRCEAEVQPTPLPSCFMARAGVFDTVGMLRTDTDATFVDWYMRAMEGGLSISFVPELIARRRIHTANQSYRNSEVRRDYIRIIKASLDRRRRAAAAKG